MLTPAD